MRLPVQEDVKGYLEQDKNNHQRHGGIELHDEDSACNDGDMHHDDPLIRPVHELLYGCFFVFAAQYIVFDK